MAGPDLQFGTSDDETWSDATRPALKAVIEAADLSGTLAAGATLDAPSITSLTTMVAEKLGKAPTATEIDAAKSAVATSTGLASKADVYKNPMTNGEVFKAATLVNEMVANAIKVDPTKKPEDLIKAMASNVTAKLTDADPTAMFGTAMSAANAAVLQEQMASMQAKAAAMKSVADAVAANVTSASAASLNPAKAAEALNLALKSTTDGNAIATEIAKAQMAQDAIKQMNTQMEALRTGGVSATELADRMKAVVQGLEAVRTQQESSIKTAITSAGGDATKIADAVKQASSVIVSSASMLFDQAKTASIADVQSKEFMNAAASKIAGEIEKVDPAKLAAAVTAAGGDPSKVDFLAMGLDKASIATSVATVATEAAKLQLNLPSALTDQMLGGQVVGMVVQRATNKGYLSSTYLQAWVDAIGKALAANEAGSLNPNSLGYTLGEYFYTKQPDLTVAPPSDLALKIGEAPTFTPTGGDPTSGGTPTGGTPTGGTTTGGTTTGGTPTGGTTTGGTPTGGTTTGGTPTGGTTTGGTTTGGTPTGGTTSGGTPTTGGTPSATAGATIYANACGACHGGQLVANSTMRGRTAAQISAAISGNVGNMGFLATSLTADNIASIAAALQ